MRRCFHSGKRAVVWEGISFEEKTSIMRRKVYSLWWKIYVMRRTFPYRSSKISIWEGSSIIKKENSTMRRKFYFQKSSTMRRKFFLGKRALLWEEKSTVKKGIYNQKEVLFCIDMFVRESNSIIRSSLRKNNSFVRRKFYYEKEGLSG